MIWIHQMANKRRFDLDSSDSWHVAGFDVVDRKRTEQLRVEERVNERTRIARELHDTLLQSVQGLLMHLSAVRYLIPNRPGDAAELLDRMVERAREAVAEGRDAVQGLRSSIDVSKDLVTAITAFGEGLANDANSPEFRVTIEGKVRDLPPLVCDEVHRIAGEALRNAFRHAAAARIEVQIYYDVEEFRLRVRDNGKGIASAVLDAGRRVGHHGLPGMRERAELVGGILTIRSEPDSGSEIELTISAALAYRNTSLLYAENTHIAKGPSFCR
jgi:signal transduction histidine kinase